MNQQLMCSTTVSKLAENSVTVTFDYYVLCVYVTYKRIIIFMQRICFNNIMYKYAY